MRRGRQGQSLVSLVLFTGIVLVGVGTVITVTGPVLQNLQDAAAVDSAKDVLSGLQDQIERVAEGGEGSQVTTSVTFRRGELLFDSAADEIAYEVDTDAEIIAPHTSRQTGNLLLSAMARVSVTRASVDGQDCWRVENDHVQVCIRRVVGPGEMIEVDTAGFWRFSQGAGQVAADNSTHGNNGTLGASDASESSDPGRVAGLRGNALDFDGSDDVVEVPDAATLDLDEQTVAAWVNADGLSHDGVVVGKDNQYRLWLDGAGSDVVRYQLRIGGSWQCDARIGTGNLSTGTWHHLAGTYNGSQCAVYLDGTPVQTVDQTGSVNTAATTLGIGNTPGNSNYLDGTVDDVRLWNRSLTAEEVRWQYNASGYLDYVDTRDLLLRYRNKDAGKNLSADFEVKVNTDRAAADAFTRNGTGTVTPTLTGDHLGRGRVTAELSSFYGIDYDIVFQLFSGADFLQVNVEE
ncbi:MAG: LamG domain-containing protein [Candidatus Nanohaloarchaea archaeon]|nr:LamG domain-containing protein [Candidatus Nanohaloarchaea archaeon]